MKAQTAIMNVLLRVVGLWGPEFEHTNALGLQDEVEHGWQVGRWVDHTNPQWSSFRDSLFILVPAMLAISLISRAVQRAAPRAHRPVMLVVGLAFLIRAHGSRTLYFLTAAALNYAAARALPSSWVAEPSLWALNLALLVAIRFYHGFSSSFLPAVLRAPLDALGGDVRWDVCFNISMLRFLSFGLDLARARREHRAGKVPPRLGKVKAGEEEAAGDRRDPGSLPVEAYTAGAYLEYVAYPPLYVAGPIVTFDNFTRARLSPPGMLPAGFLVRYAARAALGIMCVEVLLHFNYLDFIVKVRLGVCMWRCCRAWTERV